MVFGLLACLRGRRRGGVCVVSDSAGMAAAAALDFAAGEDGGDGVEDCYNALLLLTSCVSKMYCVCIHVCVCMCVR